jgi:hypothetical protein
VSQEPTPAAGVPADDTAVVEWGGEEQRPSRRAMLAKAFAGAGRDHRLVPVVAGLGAIAIFASLIGEWQLTTITDPETFGPNAVTAPISADLGQLQGWAAGYVLGIFALAACVGLVLFGRPAVRHHARIVGLTTAGVLLALLAAITAYLNDDSIYLGPAAFNDVNHEVAYGRGLTMAFLGVGALAVALYLAGRLMPAPPPAAETAAAQAAEPPTEEPDWPWRRRDARQPHEVESDLPAPADLTVAPTAPFVPLPDQKSDD